MTTIKSLSDVLGTGLSSEDLKKFLLANFLKKLGLKSIDMSPFVGGPLKVESLEATLKQVTFDVGNLKLWSEIDSGLDPDQ